MKDNQTVLKDSERSSCIDKHHDLAEEAVKSYNPDVKTTTLIPASAKPAMILSNLSSSLLV